MEMIRSNKCLNQSLDKLLAMLSFLSMLLFINIANFGKIKIENLQYKKFSVTLYLVFADLSKFYLQISLEQKMLKYMFIIYRVCFFY